MTNSRRVTARTPNAVQVIQDALQNGLRVMAHCGHWFQVKAFKVETDGDYNYWYAQPLHLHVNQREGLVWYNVNTFSIEVATAQAPSLERDRAPREREV